MPIQRSVLAQPGINAALLRRAAGKSRLAADRYPLGRTAGQRSVLPPPLWASMSYDY